MARKSLGIQAGYYGRLAAAFVRGCALSGAPSDVGDPGLSPALLHGPLDSLIDDDLDRIIAAGIAWGLPLFPFKRRRIVPRIAWALGVLQTIRPTSLLDVGPGRGSSLWPIMVACPSMRATALDADLTHVRNLAAVRFGGLKTLSVLRGSATGLPFSKSSFDGVTILEVLEHLEEPASAVAEAARVARRFVMATVPSRPDENPEHLQLFGVEEMAGLFEGAGLGQVKVGGVPGHITILGWNPNPAPPTTG